MMWITRCLAEAAEAAEETAATAAQVSGGLDIIHIALIGVGLYLLITGILTAVTKKFYGGLEKGYEKYTPESVQSCMTIIGLQNVLVGLGLIAIEVTGTLGWGWTPRLIIAGVVIVIALLSGLPMNKKLVKK